MKKAYLILGELDNEDLDWIVSNSHKRQLEPGETLIYEEQPISALYFVLSGCLQVFIRTQEDKEIARISEGEVVGEISFIDTHLPIATVRAISECVVLEIPKFHLTDRLRRDMSFAVRFYRGISQCLSDRMRGTVQRLGYGIDIDELTAEEPTKDLSPGEQQDLELVQAKFHWLVQNATG